MRGKAIGLVIVVLALLLLAAPGLAAGGGGMGSKSFNLLGTIVDYDCPDPEVEEDTWYIMVDQSWPGTGQVSVVTNEYTQYKQCTTEGPGSANLITCGELVVGYKVRIIGEKEDNGILIALRVVQYVPEPEE